MSDKEEDQSFDSSVDELKSRHRKEKKDLVAKITTLKHTVNNNDKKRKKEMQQTIAEWEKELKERHAKELEDLCAATAEMTVKSPADENPAQSADRDGDTQAKKPSKAEKRRAKEAEKNRRRVEAMKADEEAEATSRGHLERENIAQKLLLKDLRIHEIRPDGDCLFNAVSHQISLLEPNTFISGDIVRERAANFIQQNGDEFLPFIENAEDAEDLKKYCLKVQKMCRDGGDWGGAAEIKAISGSFQRPIHVIHADGVPHTFGDEFSTDPLIITYHRHAFTLGEHYNSTCPLAS